MQSLALVRPLLCDQVRQKFAWQQRLLALGAAQGASIEQNSETAVHLSDRNCAVEPPGLVAGFVKSSRQVLNNPVVSRPGLRRFWVT